MYITDIRISLGYDSDTLHGQWKILNTNRISRKAEETLQTDRRKLVPIPMSNISSTYKNFFFPLSQKYPKQYTMFRKQIPSHNTTPPPPKKVTHNRSLDERSALLSGCNHKSC
jgi:hypothetical protein